MQNVYDAIVDKVKLDLAAVKTINVMLDGWTDKHHAMHYLGLRVQFISNDWVGKVVTLSVKPCAGDAHSIYDHIRKELDYFIPDHEHKELFSTHDGAAVMKKVSKLLRITDFVHCTAHALHLLLTTDSILKVSALQTLLEKFKNIVNTLHYESELIENEVLATNNITASADFLDKISKIKSILDADKQIAVDENSSESDNNDGKETNFTMKMNKQKIKKVHRLQNEVPTRWNLSYQMIDSVLHLRTEVANALKQTGHYELCLKGHELILLENLRNFPQSFVGLTELLRSSITTLSLVPLIRAEIIDICLASSKDSDELKSLKTLIKRNRDEHLPLTNVVRLSTLLDPTTKHFINEMNEADKEELIYSAAAAVQEQPSNNQPNETDSATSSSASLSQFANASDSNANASTCSYLPTASKKLKLVRKHAPQYQHDSRLRDDIKNYLRYLPTDNEDDPLNF